VRGDLAARVLSTDAFFGNLYRNDSRLVRRTIKAGKWAFQATGHGGAVREVVMEMESVVSSFCSL